MVSAPPLARLYAGLRRLPPELSLPVLVGTAALLAVVAVATGAFLAVPWVIVGGMIASAAAVPVALAVTTPREYWWSEHGLLDLSLTRILLALGGAVAPGVAIAALVPGVRSFLPLTVLPGAALVAVGQAAGGKYDGERMFHVPADSPLSDDWIRASVALERGVDDFNAAESYAAYHWLEDARRRYDHLADETERPVKAEVAAQHAAAATALRDACFEDSHSGREAAIATYEGKLDTAGEMLSHRICDECGDRHPVEECVRIEGETELYCEPCFRELDVDDEDESEVTGEETDETEQSDQAETDDGETSTTSDTTDESERSTNTSTDTDGRRRKTGTGRSTGSNRRRGRNSTTSSTDDDEEDGADDEEGDSKDDSTGGGSRAEADGSSSGSPGPEHMSVDEARKVLGVEGRLTPGKIEEAYRKQTKENHPDVGGSEEAMRRINKARDRLEEAMS